MRGVRFQAGWLKVGAGTQGVLCFPEVGPGQQGVVPQDVLPGPSQICLEQVAFGACPQLLVKDTGKEHSQTSARGVLWRQALTVVTITS